MGHADPDGEIGRAPHDADDEVGREHAAAEHGHQVATTPGRTPGFSKTVERTIVVRVLTGWPGSRSTLEHIAELVERRCRHLQDVAILACNMMALEYVRMFGQALDTTLETAAVGHGIAHRDKGGDGPPDARAIDVRVVAGDVSRLLEPLDPLHDGGAGQPDFVGDGLVGHAAIGGQQVEDLEGDVVEFVGHGPCGPGRERY